jgi:hypothetical protein
LEANLLTIMPINTLAIATQVAATKFRPKARRGEREN